MVRHVNLPRQGHLFALDSQLREASEQNGLRDSSGDIRDVHSTSSASTLISSDLDAIVCSSCAFRFLAFHNSVRLACCGGAGFAFLGISKNLPASTRSGISLVVITEGLTKSLLARHDEDASKTTSKHEPVNSSQAGRRWYRNDGLARLPAASPQAAGFGRRKSPPGKQRQVGWCCTVFGYSTDPPSHAQRHLQWPNKCVYHTNGRCILAERCPLD
jgi:hypothetical protein